MARDDAERSSFGRTALGGAACGLTYDGVMRDAMAREDRLRRPLSLGRWHGAKPSVSSPLGECRDRLETASPNDRH